MATQSLGDRVREIVRDEMGKMMRQMVREEITSVIRADIHHIIQEETQTTPVAPRNNNMQVATFGGQQLTALSKGAANDVALITRQTFNREIFPKLMNGLDKMYFNPDQQFTDDGVDYLKQVSAKHTPTAGSGTTAQSLHFAFE